MIAGPSTLLDAFGTPEFVIGLELSPERQLASEDVGEVMANLRRTGELAATINDAGLICVCALTAPERRRRWRYQPLCSPLGSRQIK